MKTWETLRAYLLVATLGASGLAIAKVTLTGARDSLRLPSYDLPTQISIPNWQFRQSHLTTAHSKRGPALVSSVDDQAIAARRYQYVRNGMPLDIEVRYFVKTYRHVPAIIEDSTLLSIKPALRDRKHPDLGSYVLYANQGKIHLSACLDPSGKTAVYDNELTLNQARPEVLAPRIVPWVLGQAPLRDLRCLWVDLSMPLTQTGASPSRGLDPDQVDPKPLEEAFVEWLDWWNQNYPSEPQS